MNLLDALLGVLQIQADGSPLPRRSAVNFQGLTATDDPDNDRTNVAAAAAPGAIVTIQHIQQLGGVTVTNNISVVDVPDLQLDTLPGEKWVIQWVLRVSFSNPAGIRVQVFWPGAPIIADVHAVLMTTNGATTIVPVVNIACTASIAEDLVFQPASGTEGYLTIDLLLHNDAGSGKAKLKFAQGTATGSTNVGRNSFMRAYRSN